MSSAGGPVEREGNRAVISSPGSDEPGIRTPSFTVYLQTGSSWGAADTITAPDGVDPRAARKASAPRSRCEAQIS